MFLILPLSSGNGNELNNFLWTSVALDELQKDHKHSFSARLGHNYHLSFVPWGSGLQHLPDVYSWKPQKSKYCLISVRGISPFRSDNFVCFSCSEIWRSWSACGTEWGRSTIPTWALRPYDCLLLKSNETEITPFGSNTLYIPLELQDLLGKTCRILQIFFREKWTLFN